SANIHLIGEAVGTIDGISFFAGGALPTTVQSASGSITIETDRLHTNSHALLTSTESGSLIIQPLTPETEIGIAAGQGTLRVLTAHLDMIQDGFSEIVIGHQD